MAKNKMTLYIDSVTTSSRNKYGQTIYQKTLELGLSNGMSLTKSFSAMTEYNLDRNVLDFLTDLRRQIDAEIKYLKGKYK